MSSLVVWGPFAFLDGSSTAKQRSQPRRSGLVVSPCPCRFYEGNDGRCNAAITLVINGAVISGGAGVTAVIGLRTLAVEVLETVVLMSAAVVMTPKLP